jgi:hypothetical protein
VQDAEPVTIAITDSSHVSGLLLAPANTRACYVFAHGAGAGMRHAFMAAVALELAERGIATLRYQFPYMEKGGRRPDPPKPRSQPPCGSCQSVRWSRAASRLAAA